MKPTSTPRLRAVCALALALCAAAHLTACVDDGAQAPQTPTASRAQDVVYGEDDRTDVYAHPDARLREIAQRSIVALMDPDDLDLDDPDNVRVFGDRLGPSMGLCDDQRFFDQIRGASCSGTLIDDDLVLTAGHCMPSQARCDDRYVLFNYYMADEDNLAQRTADDVYACERIVVYRDDGDQDYTIFQLDRPVVGPRVPAAVRSGDRAMEAGEKVTMMGFPNGLPLKIAANGSVTRPRATTLDYFEATVDAFGGNSGSGVFGPEDEIVGILVRGETDYTTRGDCRVVNVLPEEGASDGNSEDITYASRAIEALCATGFPSERLCAGDGTRTWCFPCEADTDCAEGFTCTAWDDAPDAPTCVPSCASSADCRDDHTCQDGACLPRRSPVCSEGRPFEIDRCGRLLIDGGPCDEGTVCAAGACVEQGDNDTCASAIDLEPVSQTLQGDLSLGFNDDRQGSCGGFGPDAMYTFTLEAESNFRAAALGYDSVLHLRTACDSFDTQVACNDDTSRSDRQARLNLDLEPGTYTLIVDAYGNDTDDYTLELEFGPACGEIVCAEGDTRCDGEEGVAACAFDEQGCPFWDAATPCDDGTICIFDACAEPGEGDTCEDPIVLEPVSQTFEGILDRQRFRNDVSGSCAGNGPDRIYQLDLPARSRVEASAFGYDTVLHLRSDCTSGDSEVTCNDDNEPPGFRGSRIEAELEAGTWFLALDAFNFATGNYAMELVVEPLVECDNVCTALGEVACAGPGGVQTCVERDGCLEWDLPVLCAPGQACQDGVCVESCVSDCLDEGAVRCIEGGDAQACAPTADDPACLRWSEPAVCGDEAVCVPGVGCQTVEPPEDAGQGDTGTPDATPDAAVTPDADPEPDTGVDADLPKDDDETPPVVIDDPDTTGDDGCGCATPAAPTPERPAALGLALALGAVVVFRRRRKR